VDYKIYQNKINIYHFIHHLFLNIKKDNIVVCADGAATVVPGQIGYVKKGVNLILNSGSASMGYDLPAVVGVGTNSKKKIICLAGDGSIMMNLQELQTIKNMNLDVIIFILNNKGYLSIKQTQKNFFGNEYGASPGSNLSFPNFKKISHSFGIKNYSISLNNYKKKIVNILDKKGPIICEVILDTKQEFEPKLKSRFSKGKIVTPELDDMYPFLDNKIFKEIKKKLIEYTK
jgi:acetolactate synthase-1/2/3 large subunit